MKSSCRHSSVSCQVSGDLEVCSWPMTSWARAKESVCGLVDGWVADTHSIWLKSTTHRYSTTYTCSKCMPSRQVAVRPVLFGLNILVKRAVFSNSCLTLFLLGLGAKLLDLRITCICYLTMYMHAMRARFTIVLGHYCCSVNLYFSLHHDQLLRVVLYYSLSLRTLTMNW